MQQCQVLFVQVKEALCRESLLPPLNFYLFFVLETDALNRRLGAVWSQQVRRIDCLVVYITRKLLK